MRLKREMDAMKPSVGAGGNVNEINEDMRIENIKLKSRIITMEKEIQELQLKASKSNVKDKSNEQSVSNQLLLSLTFSMPYVSRSPLALRCVFTTHNSDD